MSQTESPPFGASASSNGSSATQEQPGFHSDVTTAAQRPHFQDDDKSNTASERKPETARIQETINPNVENLHQAVRRVPGIQLEIPPIAFRMTVYGIIRRLVEEVEGNTGTAGEFAQQCSAELSHPDLQAIAQFQGQLGSPGTLGGDPPYQVAKHMEISHRYSLYEDSYFDLVKTEDAFRRLFQSAKEIAKEMGFQQMERYASESLRI
ncbi:uncharacterized protein HRG_06770 [Hirsutella rhossiliensis]|uniref:Uncharacterized protein n=1 Tax=Hirsutella rhossiliensis TaxID=111463 RepID=A0A9P8MV39_9HYPO|nr:uncharacterized protein HRG_06770 [Hirsutella rhossiliensis]KAH0962668.1 hypothetical protein HRG_06770 [Hirsutella rhossiliensis]